MIFYLKLLWINSKIFYLLLYVIIYTNKLGFALENYYNFTFLFLFLSSISPLILKWFYSINISSIYFLIWVLIKNLSNQPLLALNPGIYEKTQAYFFIFPLFKVILIFSFILYSISHYFI